MNESPANSSACDGQSFLPTDTATACDNWKARDQLNKGVQSYKNARYEEAINHFQTAVALDSALLNARLYLATAYAQQYIPGVGSDVRIIVRQREAIEQFKGVLDAQLSRDQQVSSLKGIASLSEHA